MLLAGHRVCEKGKCRKSGELRQRINVAEFLKIVSCQHETLEIRQLCRKIIGDTTETNTIVEFRRKTKEKSLTLSDCCWAKDIWFAVSTENRRAFSSHCRWSRWCRTGQALRPYFVFLEFCNLRHNKKLQQILESSKFYRVSLTSEVKFTITAWIDVLHAWVN